MRDSASVYANVAIAAGAMTFPKIETGIDTQEVSAIGMRLVILFVTGVAAYRSAERLLEEEAKQNAAETALERANTLLVGSIAKLEQRNREATSLTSMGRLLQSTASVAELYSVLTSYMKDLFPQTSGALFIYSASRNDLDAAVKWGGGEERFIDFAPDECWALRHGQLYQQDASHPGLHCDHVKRLESPHYLCMPLMARGETLGVLHIRFAVDGQAEEAPVPGSGMAMEHVSALASSTSEYVALALANQMLRETLRNQAIRDPLTGLFNRRFAEETLERELLRAARNEVSVTFIYFDVDHFKQFNDAYGHEAGDVVLQKIGATVKKVLRGEDVACRYGGEEFLVILADSTVEVGSERAETLREQVKSLTIKFGSQFVGPITVSLGVAGYPTDGSTPGAILAAADAALYQAKAAGRDCVVVAGPG
jgi:diguanylate cyclase (GGDEF)-like protein